jgi:hypothetical protein
MIRCWNPGENFLSSPNRPCRLWAYPLIGYPKVKRPDYEADHPPLFIVKVKSEWSITSTSPICIYLVDRETFTFTFTSTYLLTQWSSVLLVKLTGSQLVTKFPAF